MNKEERIKMAKAMEFIARQINDEDVLYEEFQELVDTFLSCMNRARRSGGLYCDNITTELLIGSHEALTETITDSWEDILAAVADGTYKTKYNVGDTKILDLGSEGSVCMQIAAFDADTLADGTGKAPISWISEQLLTTSRRMNPYLEDSAGNYTEGTGSIGGWEKSEMRSYLKNTVKPLIPETVRNAIKEVTKTQPAYNTDKSSYAQISMDDVWIPSFNEVFGASSLYYPFFQNTAANRIKKKTGATSPSNWWLRSAYNTNTFYFVYSSGYNDYYNAYTTRGVVLGFCT